MVHRYSLASNMLVNQNIIEKIKPLATVIMFMEPLINGSTKTEAKTTWAISRAISERVFNLASDDIISDYIIVIISTLTSGSNFKFILPP